MKILYIECKMGAAGDMLMGALSELIPDQDSFLSEMNSPGIPGVKVQRQTKDSCGIKGSHMQVLVHGEEEGHQHSEHSHHHYGMAEIRDIIEKFDVSDKVKKDAKAVYEIIGNAEAQVHGAEMENIHFHEVGSLDAVTDVIGCCILVESIGADKIIVSPVHVGAGTVKCAHGILPVPAPATALILQGAPIYGGSIDGELCTPTGAAVLKYFADEFGPMPEMKVGKIGYGMGTKDFEQANCVRAMVGEAVSTSGDSVIELACNIDDMTAEDMAYAAEKLMEAGALDVYTEPIVMKKSRLASKFVCMARPEDKERLTSLMFRHTATIGIREYRCDRHVLNRRSGRAQTPWGPISVKISDGFGVSKVKAEYDDLEKMASENDLTVEEIRQAIRAWKNDRSVIK